MTKVGDIYLQVSDDDSGKITWNEYHVRSIRKGRVYATLKARFTWGKVSAKHGDFGWLDPVPAWCRESWQDGNEPPMDLARTRIAALKKAITSHEKFSEPDDYPDPALYDKTLTTLRKMLVREQNAAKAKRATSKKRAEPARKSM
ncbi:hypothetical protein [Brucella anthropi]|uniref:hypothetical protein n=1 Tax=Brucella anthropi TaxID=529 RepID=UPI0021581929|nr:hypothetical protein [Brucella anthropi]MCR8493678.1 hypothetical protein [Brucella anthropi]